MSQTYTLDKHNRDWKFVDVQYAFPSVPFYMLENIWHNVYFTNRFKIGVATEEFNEREALNRKFLIASAELEMKSLIHSMQQTIFFMQEQAVRNEIEREMFESFTFIDFEYEVFVKERNERRVLFGEMLLFSRAKLERLTCSKFEYQLTLLSMKLIAETNRQLLRETENPITQRTQNQQAPKQQTPKVVNDESILEQLKDLIFHEKREYQFITAASKLVDIEIRKTTMGIMGIMKSRTGEPIHFSLHHQCGHQRRVQNTVRNVMTQTLRLAGWIE